MATSVVLGLGTYSVRMVSVYEVLEIRSDEKAWGWIRVYREMGEDFLGGCCEISGNDDFTWL